MITHIMKADQAVEKYDVLTIGRFDNTVAKVAWPDTESVSNVIGIALNGGGDGADITICIYGVIVDPIFNFEPKKPIYVNNAGKMTQVLPDQSIFKLGKALSQDAVLINLSELFLLFKP